MSLFRLSKICDYFLHFHLLLIQTEPIKECRFEQINEIEGYIANTDINGTYISQVNESQAALDCLWMIEVKPDWKVKPKKSSIAPVFICSFSLSICLLFLYTDTTTCVRAFLI